jgi:hypothetical protein
VSASGCTCITKASPFFAAVSGIEHSARAQSGELYRYSQLAKMYPADEIPQVTNLSRLFVRKQDECLPRRMRQEPTHALLVQGRRR